MSEREAIYRALAPFIRGRTTAEWIDRLRSHGVWCAPVHDYEQMLDDPAVQYADPLLQIDHPQAGRVQLLKHPVRYSGGQPEVQRMPPALGEQTDEVLHEIGYTSDEIRELREAGAV
jgi:crotonobetainyl-CoA:carnitine CoA-transferase CaiB-like acyl-CoA transferase